MNLLMLLTLALMSMVVGPISAQGAQESAQRHHIIRRHHVTTPNPGRRAPDCNDSGPTHRFAAHFGP
jgi:hypothetical protein